MIQENSPSAWEQCGMTVEDIRKAAAAVKAMDEQGRGKELDRNVVVKQLRLIAAGKLLPEVFMLCSGFMICRMISNLPIPIQQKLASGDPLQVVTLSPDGTAIVNPVPLREMTAKQARQVFTNDHLRDQDEQRAFLDSKNPLPVARIVHVGKFELDAEAGVFKYLGEEGDRISLREIKECVKVIRQHRSHAGRQ